MNNSTGKRYLIVNADDFGRSRGINRGIVRAHELGIVTSASLMVRWPAAIEAAMYGYEHPDLSLGLHLDLEEVSWDHGAWVQSYQVVDGCDSNAVEREALLQLEAFRRITGKNPTHLDSHQCIHQNEPIRAVLTGIADWLGIPVRGFSWRVQHCGDFYGQDSKGRPAPQSITVEGFGRTVAALGPGVTELSCHPGETGDWDSMYMAERERELQTLCDLRVHSKLVELGIELCSFDDLDLIDRQEFVASSVGFRRSRRTA